jgi:hypothetical protein
LSHKIVPILGSISRPYDIGEHCPDCSKLLGEDGPCRQDRGSVLAPSMLVHAVPARSPLPEPRPSGTGIVVRPRGGSTLVWFFPLGAPDAATIHEVLSTDLIPLRMTLEDAEEEVFDGLGEAALKATGTMAETLRPLLWALSTFFNPELSDPDQRCPACLTGLHPTWTECAGCDRAVTAEGAMPYCKFCFRAMWEPCSPGDSYPYFDTAKGEDPPPCAPGHQHEDFIYWVVRDEDQGLDLPTVMRLQQARIWGHEPLDFLPTRALNSDTAADWIVTHEALLSEALGALAYDRHDTAIALRDQAANPMPTDQPGEAEAAAEEAQDLEEERKHLLRMKAQLRAFLVGPEVAGDRFLPTSGTSVTTRQKSQRWAGAGKVVRAWWDEDMIPWADVEWPAGCFGPDQHEAWTLPHLVDDLHFDSEEPPF